MVILIKFDVSEINMEAVPYHPLLEVTNEQFRSTRKFYDIENIKVLNESLDSVEEWIKKQDHLSEAGRHLGNRRFMLCHTFFVLIEVKLH